MTSIEPVFLDQRGDPAGTSPSSGSPRPTRARGCPARRPDSARCRRRSTRSGCVELPQHGVEPLARKAGPRRDAEPRELEHPVRLLPGEEVRELVGADHEERIVELARPEQVDRARVRIEPTSSSGNAARASSRRDLGAARTRPCAPAPPRRARGAGQVEVRLGRPRDRDVAVVRRIERAAERPGASRPLEHLVADLDLVAFARAGGLQRSPRARRRARATSPETRKPVSVRKTRKRRLAGCGR